MNSLTFEESIEIGRQTLELDPLSPGVYNELGWALWFAGRDDEALALYRQGLEIEPDRAQTHGLIIMIDVKKGEYDKALAYLAQLDPVQPDTAVKKLAAHVGNRPLDVQAKRA